MRLGIDIGGTSIKAAGVEGDRAIWTGQSGFYARPDIERLFAAIREAVDGRANNLEAIGVCAPGLFDAVSGTITLSFNVPGLVGISLDRLVPEALGLSINCRANICNDAQAAAVDVFRSRGIKGRLLVLTLGTGIGTAVLDDGVPLRVEGDGPGHFGQIDVSIAGHDVVGPDGGAGGLEGYLGVAAIRAKYGGDLSNFSGDEPAMLALVRAVRIAHAIYRPDHVCLCGGVGIRLKYLLATLRGRIGDRLTNLAREGWTFTCGEDDFHAARGVARMGDNRVAGDAAKS